MTKIAVFASGNGSNFQAIIEAINQKKLDCEIALLLSDQPGAKALERAEQARIPALFLNPKEFQNKVAYEEAILQKLNEVQVEFIILAGYMRLIGSTLLEAYHKKIINIHPSLLPAFPGKDAIGQALAAKVNETGVTIHYVDEGMDTGPILSQRAIKVGTDETRETLTAKIQRVEHELYPQTLASLLNKNPLPK